MWQIINPIKIKNMTKIKEITCLFALLLIISCSKGLESAAKEQMEKTMKELAKDPSSIQISNVETKFNNDSICQSKN